jgi:uncharacterized membrane protein
MDKPHRVSWYVIIYKLLFGLIEFLGGLATWLKGSQLSQIYYQYITSELSEDPHDLLARLSVKVIPNLLTHHITLILYLLLLGGAKIAGAIGLIYRQNWGVDLLVGLTLILLPFQLVDFILHPSIFSVLYIVLGVFIALYLVEFKPGAWISRRLRWFQRH